MRVRSGLCGSKRYMTDVAGQHLWRIWSAMVQWSLNDSTPLGLLKSNTIHGTEDGDGRSYRPATKG